MKNIITTVGTSIFENYKRCFLNGQDSINEAYETLVNSWNSINTSYSNLIVGQRTTAIFCVLGRVLS